MEIEHEATFENVSKDAAREAFRKAGATCVRPEYQQRRYVFNLPTGHEMQGGWLRVRDEGDKVTMSLKVVDGDRMENQKEICLTVDDFLAAKEFLALVGAQEKAYQETLREKWTLGEVELTIDEWPFLEPFVEVEGKSEEAVRAAVKMLGWDYEKALFGSVDLLYSRKYGFPRDQFNNRTARVVFDMENPFV